MKKYALTILVTVAATALVTAAGSMYLLDSTGLPEGFVQEDMFSEVLDEEREVIIDVPDSYYRNTDQAYPVVYVLGGSTLTFSVASTVDLMSRIEAMPEAIVVGIPNPSQDTRQRDLTPPFMLRDLDEADSELGAADEYLSFIEHEVVPLVEGQYRTSNFRMVVGHSREGLCVMYSLMTRPSLFDARFVHSPALWREDNVFVTRFEAFLDSIPTLDSYVFMSLGDAEVEKMRRAYNMTVEALEKHGPPGLRWHSSITVAETHANNALMATPVGFHQLFEDPWE